MKIEPFALERWMTAHELSATHDIAESGILPLSTNDLLAFEEPEERRTHLEELLETPLGYSEASGSLELRTTLASTYRGCGPENILVTTPVCPEYFLEGGDSSRATTLTRSPSLIVVWRVLPF